MANAKNIDFMSAALRRMVMKEAYLRGITVAEFLRAALKDEEKKEKEDELEDVVHTEEDVERLLAEMDAGIGVYRYKSAKECIEALEKELKSSHV